MAIIVSHTNADIFDEHSCIEAKLAHLVAGRWQPTEAELEQVIGHIIICKHCQSALETLIAVRAENDDAEDCSGAAASDLLSKMTRIIHELDAQNDISAYIEVLEIQGEDEACKQYPVLAEHLKRCKACQYLLDETRTLLHRAEEDGLIMPLAYGNAARTIIENG